MTSRSSRMIVDLLSERDMPQASLSAATNTSYSYANKVVTGKVLPNAGWIGMVSDVMGLEESRRSELVVSAVADLAASKGYSGVVEDLVETIRIQREALQRIAQDQGPCGDVARSALARK